MLKQDQPSRSRSFRFQDDGKPGKKKTQADRPRQKELQQLRTIPRLSGNNSLNLDFLDFWE